MKTGFLGLQLLTLIAIFLVAHGSESVGRPVSASSFPGSNGLILTQNATRDLVGLDPLSGAEAIVIGPRDYFGFQGGSWSPDGSQIAFGAISPLFCIVCNLGIGTVNSDNTSFSPIASASSSPSWSPDSSSLVFTEPREDVSDPPGQLLIMPADGGTPVGVPGAFGGSPVWSPSANRIAYIDGSGDVRIVDPSGANNVFLANVKGGVKWAPDGESLYSVCDNGTEDVICRIAVPSGAVQMFNNAVGFAPAPSPDGNLFAYIADADYSVNIRSTTVNANPSQLTPGGFPRTSLDWQPVLSPSSTNDWDQDGIPDDWEESLGGHPRIPDIFVYVDWMRGYEPNWTALSSVVAAFRAQGIDLHILKGIEVAHAPNFLPEHLGTVLDEALERMPGRGRHVFHYALYVEKYVKADGHCRGGFSVSAPASEFVIAIGCDATRMPSHIESATFMHELGHNLGLCHDGALREMEARWGASIAAKVCSGDIEGNNKPNYLSVMNYIYQDGVIRNGFRTPDYSGISSDLHEEFLTEDVGFNLGILDRYSVAWHCPETLLVKVARANAQIDWDCNGHITGSVAADVNGDSRIRQLFGSNDWNNLIFTYEGSRVGIVNADTQRLGSIATEIEEIPYDELVEISAVKDAFLRELTLEEGNSATVGGESTSTPVPIATLPSIVATSQPTASTIPSVITPPSTGSAGLKGVDHEVGGAP